MIMEIQDHSGGRGIRQNGNAHATGSPMMAEEAAYGYPRHFLQHHFVYLVISPRARGLSLGINLNPVVKCHFGCAYCEVDREKPGRASHLNVQVMAEEHSRTLSLAHQGHLRKLPRYARLPAELVQVRYVGLSGDGEAT